jgi:hypothetical protein
LEYVYIEDGGRVAPEVLCVIMQGETKCEGTASLEEWSVKIDANKPPVEDKVMPEVGSTNKYDNFTETIVFLT